MRKMIIVAWLLASAATCIAQTTQPLPGWTVTPDQYKALQDKLNQKHPTTAEVIRERMIEADNLQADAAARLATIPVPQESGSNITVYFSPDGGCAKAIIDQLNAAKRSVYVQAYELTSIPICKAIANAKMRGCEVRILFDPRIYAGSQKEQQLAQDFANNGVMVMLDTNYETAHNKIILIDNFTTITGSYNFTDSAETRNAENMLVIQGQAIASAYLTNFAVHWNQVLPNGGNR